MSRQNIVVQVTSDCMGQGDDTLGKKLMTSFFNVLPEEDAKPKTIILYNTAVRLACEGSEVLDILKDFEKHGVTILCCGTCLNFFELKNKRQVGIESNMFDITRTLLEADHVVKP